MSAGVDQRAAGIAGVDRRVRLDEVFEAVDAELVTAKRADDSHRNGAAEAERIADGEHDVAHLNGFGRGECDRGQVVAIGFENREI